VHLPGRPWEAPVQAFSDSVSLPVDQIKYVSALLAGIPIGLVFRCITADPFSMQVSDEHKTETSSCNIAVPFLVHMHHGRGILWSVFAFNDTDMHDLHTVRLIVFDGATATTGH